MMKITGINWMSKEGLEAEVILTDGKFELRCFSQPFNYNLNDVINTNLYCYEVSNILIQPDREYMINKLCDFFAYNLKGELINKEAGVVVIEDITVEIEKEKIPKDVKEGDYISFNCERIDIY